MAEQRSASHGYGRAWDAGLGVLGDATEKQSTATRWLSTAEPGRDDHERNETGRRQHGNN